MNEPIVYRVTKTGGDVIIITVLPDGTIKTDTDKVSMPNHENAAAFLRNVQHLAGGKTEMKLKTDLRGVLHEHTHDGHTHSH